MTYRPQPTTRTADLLGAIPIYEEPLNEISVIACERTAPHDIREILTEAALQLMDTHPELKTLRDALDIVQARIGFRHPEAR